MKSNQDITIETYEKMVESYVEGTVPFIDGQYKEHLDTSLSSIEKDAEILEVGSANGRDADYIENLGYHVTRTDIVNGFIEYQKSRGKDVSKFDVITGSMDHKYDMVLASAVFLHFNQEQFDQAIDNVIRHLKDGGYFSMTMKHGEGEEFSDEKVGHPRYFRYVKPAQLKCALESKGFTVHEISVTEDGKRIHCLSSITSLIEI